MAVRIVPYLVLNHGFEAYLRLRDTYSHNTPVRELSLTVQNRSIIDQGEGSR